MQERACEGLYFYFIGSGKIVGHGVGVLKPCCNEQLRMGVRFARG